MNEKRSDVQRDLGAGRGSPELKAWFRHLLQPSSKLTEEATLAAYLRLLRDCNNALSLVANTGFEVALQFVARRCLAATHSLQGEALSPDADEEWIG